MKITYYDSGEIHYVANTNSDGLYHGEVIEYRDRPHAGKVYRKCMYVDGKQHGTSKYYNNDGIIIASSTFDNDILHGKSYIYYNDSCIREICRYNRGVLDGTMYTFHNNGNLLSIRSYNNMVEHGVHISFYSNGNLKSFASFKKGVINGESLTLSQNGDIVSWCNVVDGEKTPVFVEQDRHTLMMKLRDPDFLTIDDLL